MSGYFKDIKNAVQTLSNGMKLTWDYLWDARYSRRPVGIEDDTYFDDDKGIFTLQYPYESLPVPETGRYRLHNEIEDCIVCDKCAKICPVNCIEIEPVRAVEEIGKTSDGTPMRIHAAKFDIDMAKCCFCGLCTTVCPTECLTMTQVYDFSEFDVKDHTYAFSEMTPLEILEKKQQLEAYQQAKQNIESKKTEATQTEPDSGEAKPASSIVSKPIFKPRPMMRPKPPKSE